MSYIGIGSTDPNHPLEVAGQVFVQAVESGSSSQSVPFEVFSDYYGLPHLTNSRQMRVRARPSNLNSNVNVDMGLENTSGSYFFISQPVIDQTSGDKGSFVLTQEKNIGIGTTNPQDLVHMKSDSATFLRLETQDSSDIGISIVKDGTSKWEQYMAGGDDNLYLANEAGEDVFTIEPDGSLTTTGSLSTPGGSLDSTTGDLSIMGSIDGDGYINMGSQFQVSGAGSLTCGAGATFEGDVNMKTNTTVTGVIYAWSAVFQNFALPTSNLTLDTFLPCARDTTTRFGFPTDTSDQFVVEIEGSEIFRVHNNACVGINTNIPTFALDVNGDIRAREHVYSTNLYLGASEDRGFTTPNSNISGNITTFGDGNMGYDGYMIDNSLGFLSNLDDSTYGLYDQENERWDMGSYFDNGQAFLNYGGVTKLVTLNDGVEVAGNVYCSNVAINTTTGVNDLHVVGGITFEYGNSIDATTASQTGWTNHKVLSCGWNGSQDVTQLWVPGGSSSATPRLTINSSGNIGIGTEYPNAKLELYGSPFLRFNNGGYVHWFQNGSDPNVLSLYAYGNDGQYGTFEVYTGGGPGGSARKSFVTNYNTFAHYTSVTSTGNMTAAGTVQGGYIYSTGSIAAASGVSGASMSASGNITAGGTVQGGYIYSTGSIAAASGVSGASMSASGNITAGGTVQGGYVYSTGNIAAAGTVQGGSVTSTGNITANGTLNVPNSYIKEGNRFYIESYTVTTQNSVWTDLPHSFNSYKGNFIMMAWKADTGNAWACGIWACSKRGDGDGVPGHVNAIAYQSDGSGDNLAVQWPAGQNKLQIWYYGATEAYYVTLMGQSW